MLEPIGLWRDEELRVGPAVVHLPRLRHLASNGHARNVRPILDQR